MAKIFNDANNASCMVGNERDASCLGGKNISLVKELGSSNKYTKGEQDIILRIDDGFEGKKPIKSKFVVSTTEYRLFKSYYKHLDNLPTSSKFKYFMYYTFANMPIECKTLLNKYAKRMCCLDANFTKDTAHFNHELHGFKFNEEDDLNNPFGICNTFVHESAHQLDCLMSIDGCWISSQACLGDYVRKDLKNAIILVQNQYHCNQADAKAKLCEILSKYGTAAHVVSDVFGGASNNNVVGDYGHKNIYWKKHACILDQEAFAGIFASFACNNVESLELIEIYLPETLSKFMEILRGALVYDR